VKKANSKFRLLEIYIQLTVTICHSKSTYSIMDRLAVTEH